MSKPSETKQPTEENPKVDYENRSPNTLLVPSQPTRIRDNEELQSPENHDSEIAYNQSGENPDKLSPQNKQTGTKKNMPISSDPKAVSGSGAKLNIGTPKALNIFDQIPSSFCPGASPSPT